SKATTPQAAIAALRSIEGRIILIAGGKDHGIELSEFAGVIADRTSAAVFFGETAEFLSTQASRNGPRNHHQADSLEDAVAWSWKCSSPGDVILLSPGCASFGAFANYEERGHRFSVLA